MISPSSRGLRTALEKHGVEFAMPLAPPGMCAGTTRGGAAASGSAAGSRGGGGGGAQQQQQQGDDDGMGDDGGDWDAGLNRGFDQVQPDSEAGMQHSLAALDYKTGSTLVVQGRSALHALHEFLINARPSPQTVHPYFLTLQLLAAQPFVNGEPHSPRILHQRARRPAVDGAFDGNPDSAESIRLEDAERGGGALLLPSSIRKLVYLLQAHLAHGFDLVVQPDVGGASFEAINVRQPHAPVTPHDLLSSIPARRSQPLAEIRVQGGEEAAAEAAEQQQQRQRQQQQAGHQGYKAPAEPRAISHIRFFRNGEYGELHLL